MEKAIHQLIFSHTLSVSIDFNTYSYLQAYDISDRIYSSPIHTRIFTANIYSAPTHAYILFPLSHQGYGILTYYQEITQYIHTVLYTVHTFNATPDFQSTRSFSRHSYRIAITLAALCSVIHYRSIGAGEPFPTKRRKKKGKLVTSYWFSGVCIVVTLQVNTTRSGWRLGTTTSPIRKVSSETAMVTDFPSVWLMEVSNQLRTFLILKLFFFSYTQKIDRL